MGSPSFPHRHLVGVFDLSRKALWLPPGQFWLGENHGDGLAPIYCEHRTEQELRSCLNDIRIDVGQ